MSAGPVLGRMRSAAGLLVAVFVMATVSTTLTALVPTYSSSIVEAGLQRTIAEADAAEQTVTFTWRGPASEWETVSTRATATADELLAGASSPSMFADTRSFGIGPESDSRIARIGVVEGDGLYRVVGSAEPDDAGAVPAALHVDAAAFIGIELGDTVVLEQRDAVVAVEVVELLEVVDREDTRWFDEPYGRDGVIVGETATEVGPFFVAPEWFTANAGDVTYRGRFALEPSEIEAAEIDELIDGVEAASERIAESLGATDVRLVGSLDALLVETDTALRSTGAVVGVILLQLVVVALYGLGVSAAVLAAARRGETAVARSRGASPRQLNRTTLIEAAIVIAPAALIAPWLAALAVERIGRFGPIEATGLDLIGDVTTTSVAVAFAVAVVAVIVVMLATATARDRADRGDNSSGLLYRTGLDLVLIVVAVLGLWQLARTGSVATSASPDGRATIDPVLAIAPTLGVIAASLLALRLVRVAANGLTRVGERSAALAPALAGWDSVRRPAKQARTTVLIVVAVSIGVFAAVHSVSWQESQRDQADAAVGADIHVVPNSQPGVALDADELAGTYRSIDGVDSVVPIDVRAVDLGSELTSLTMIAVDVEGFAPIDRLRPDLQADRRDLAGLAAPVDIGGVELAGSGPVAATVAVSVTPTADAERAEDVNLALLVADEYGSIIRLVADATPGSDGQAVGFGDLPPQVEAPARLVGIELVAPVRHVPLGATGDEIQPQLQFDVDISGLTVGGIETDLDGVVWRTREVSTDGSTTSAGTADVRDSDSGITV
ncbi:MAG: FtsX-like permease family protein, partial [Ilumatobacteraceae bacterium]